jgi:Cu-Zn family superoxide dismutase
MKTSLRVLAGAVGIMSVVTGVAIAQQVVVDINKISSKGVEEKIGTVTISDGKKGATFKVAVKGIPAGDHGFHVHEKGDCGPGQKDGQTQAGIAAGEHFDPDSTKTHKGPHGAGHKGDLPALKADNKGINASVTAPRVKLADIRGRSLVIHEGGDTYSDTPESGGGKGRIACGVIPR